MIMSKRIFLDLLLINILLMCLFSFQYFQSEYESDLYNGLYLVIGVVMTAVVCLSCNILLILIVMIVCVKNYKKNEFNDDLRSQ